MRAWPAVVACLLVVSGTAALPAAAQQSCGKADFESVIDETAAVLRDLNQKNKPTFQERLRQLKDKRGWSHAQFLIEAAPLVEDAKITEYDEQSAELVDNINNIGSEGASAPKPDCTLLARVRADMATLVEAQTAKWAYMFGKIDGELAR